MKKLLFFVFSAFFSSLYGQTVLYKIDTGGVRQVCDAVFTDDGGTLGNYSGNRHQTITFQSVYPSMLHLKFTFNDFDIDPSDTLFVYEGLDTLAPLIGKYNNPNTTAPFIIQSSLMNTSGAFTFRFKSDSSGSGRGWEAQLQCRYICQRVVAALSPAECSPAPVTENNYKYLNLCLYDSMTIAAKGSGNSVFPENDILYHQDESSCMFIWYFSDGTTDTGRVVRHKYNVSYGYDVHMKVIDVRGCESNNPINTRVRVPGLDIHIPSDTIPLCSGGTIAARFGSDTSSFIIVNPGNIGNFPQNINDSLLFIPDGPNCPQPCLNTTLHVMAPILFITSAAEIVSVCIGAEHSFTGDLGFRLTCPNGASVVLDPITHSGGNYLGTPYGGASHELYDNGCNPANNPAGTPGCYCWSEGFNTPVTRTLDYLCSNGPSPITQTDTLSQNNYMHPNDPFSGFIGCPVNGDWKLEICDDWSIDNGYLFWWKINFSANPGTDSLWSFTSVADSAFLQGQGVLRTDSFDFDITPYSHQGVLPYLVSVKDNFGCVYDGQFHIQVVESPQVHLVSDTTSCYLITLSVPGIYDNYLWNTGDNTRDISVVTSGIYIVTVTNYSPLISCSSVDSVIVHMLPSPVLKGHVFNDNDTVRYGRATLYNYYDFYEQYYSLFNINGEFEFNIPPGVYILQVNPDVNIYPGYLPWYYHNDLMFWDADTLSLPCSSRRDIRVNLMQEVNSQPGNGFISGHVYLVSPGSIIPVRGVRIYNQDLSTQLLVDVSISDSTGYYSFNSLNYGSYIIRPDVIGRRLSDAYTIVYDSRTHIFPDRDFYIYGDTVFSYNPLGINERYSEKGNGLVLFPNPAENELNIYTATTGDKDAELLVYDMDGRLLLTGNITGSKTVLDISLLEDGMYIIRLKTRGLYRTGKFVKN